MRSNLFRVTMMRPASNMPEVASPSVARVSRAAEMMIRKGTNQGYLARPMIVGE